MDDEDESEDFCLGPPCRHFPEWVKTPEQAREWLAYRTLVTPPYYYRRLTDGQ